MASISQSIDAKQDDNQAIEEEEAEPSAGSLQCDDCDRLFKTPALAEFHATKSGHQNFSESKEVIAALTEEEKKQKLQELKERLAEKRVQQAKIDMEEQKANELIKRKSGREARDAREALAQKQLLKDLAQKKREKAEEAALRAEIKRQIEQDKKDRLVEILLFFRVERFCNLTMEHIRLDRAVAMTWLIFSRPLLYQNLLHPYSR